MGEYLVNTYLGKCHKLLPLSAMHAALTFFASFLPMLLSTGMNRSPVLSPVNGSDRTPGGRARFWCRSSACCKPCACGQVWCLSHALCTQTYFYTGPTFESQLFHHVHVTGIPYGKKCAPCPCLK